MISRLRRARQARRAGDRGAAFVEFALATPFLLLIAMGIVEMGLGWMAANDVNAAARDAARAATSAPAYLTADRTVLVTIGRELSTAELDGLVKVVVFKAKADGTPLDPSCFGLTPNDGSPGTYQGRSLACNVYGQKQVKWVVQNPEDATKFGGNATHTGCDASELDYLWCPAIRNHSQSTNNLDYLGVYVEIKHSSVTHFNFGDMKVKRTAVFRLEPRYGGQ